MSFAVDLLGGLAQLMAAGGAGTWRESGSYLPADLDPIVVAAVPSSPDRVYTLTAYPVDVSFSFTEDVMGVQVRSRGDSDPRTAEGMDDRAFGVLQGLQNKDLPTGVHVTMVDFQSGTYVGVDGNGRHERTANYYVTAIRPSTNRT